MGKKEENKEKILELYSQGVRIEEIEKKLRISVTTIYRCINELIEEGRIQKRISVKKNINKEKTIKLYDQGLPIGEIAKKLDVSKATMSIYIKELKEEGKIQKKKRVTKKSTKKEEKKEKTLELYNQGIAIKEIAKKLGVSRATVSTYIKELKEEGKIQKKKRVTKKSTKKEEKKEKTLELYNQGILIEEIAKKLDLSKATVGIYIKELREEGKIQKKKRVTKKSIKKEENKEKTLELYNQQIPTEQIAKKLDVSKATMSIYIKELKEEGRIQEKCISAEKSKNKKKTRKKSINIQKILSKDNFTKKDYQIFLEYILQCKEKLNKRQLKKEDLGIIKKVVNITEKYDDVIFYVKACIHLGQIAEAKKTVNSARLYGDFPSEKKEKLNELARKIIEAEKKRAAIIMLKKGRGVLEAAKSSGLTEIEVVRLNRKLLSKRKSENFEKIVDSSR